MINTNKNNLKYLIIYHQITGNIYWSYNSNRSFIKRFLLVVWNIIVYLHMFIFALFVWLYFIRNGVNLKGISGGKLKLSNFLIFICYFGLMIETLVAMFTIIYHGTTMLHILESQPNSRRADKMIKFNLLLLLIFLFGTHICFSVIYTKAHPNLSYLAIFIFCINKFLAFNMEICLLSLIGYQSLTLKARLEHISDNFENLSDLSKIFKLVTLQKQDLCNFDKCINLYIGITILVRSFYLTISLFVLYFMNINESSRIVYQIFESFIQLSIIFYYSNLIQKGCQKLIHKSEKIETNSPNNCSDHCLVNRLNTIKDNMCFTAFHLYKININTFIVISIQIISFGVILIQTTQI